MKLRYSNNTSVNKVWKDIKGNKYKIFSTDDYQDKTKGRGFLFGDIGKKGKLSEDKFCYKDEEFDVYITKQKLGFFDNIYGYIPCVDEEDQEGFIRIIKTSWTRIITIIVVLILILSIAGIFYFKENDGPPLDPSAISYESVDSVVNDDPNSIALPGYSVMTYSLKLKKVYMPLINPEGNQCYFVYSIRLKETGEEIYRSGYIEPATAVTGYELNREFEIGEYDIILTANAWDINDYTVPLNGGSIETVLKVVE